MVKANMGISVLPKWSIVKVIASGEITPVRITKSGVFRKWYAASLRDVPPSPFLEEFLRLLIKEGPTAKKPARRLPRLAS